MSIVLFKRSDPFWKLIYNVGSEPEEGSEKLVELSFAFSETQIELLKDKMSEYFQRIHRDGGFISGSDIDIIGVFSKLVPIVFEMVENIVCYDLFVIRDPETLIKFLGIRRLRFDGNLIVIDQQGNSFSRKFDNAAHLFTHLKTFSYADVRVTSEEFCKYISDLEKSKKPEPKPEAKKATKKISNWTELKKAIGNFTMEYRNGTHLYIRSDSGIEFYEHLQFWFEKITERHGLDISPEFRAKLTW